MTVFCPPETWRDEGVYFWKLRHLSAICTICKPCRRWRREKNEIYGGSFFTRALGNLVRHTQYVVYYRPIFENFLARIRGSVCKWRKWPTYSLELGFNRSQERVVPYACFMKVLAISSICDMTGSTKSQAARAARLAAFFLSPVFASS